MFCGLCGTRNSRNNKFCRECGARLEPPASVQPLPEEAFEVLHATSSPAADSGKVRELLDEAFRAYEQGHLEEAQERCYQALALHPTSTSAHSLLALIYENQGDIPRAIREYQVVLEINPDSPADRASLARLQGQTEKEEEKGSSTLLLGRLRGIPARAWGAAGVFLVLLCGSLIAWGSHRRATRTAEVERLLDQGRGYYSQQRYAEATDCVQQALALDPHHSEARQMERALRQVPNLVQGNSPPVRPWPAPTSADAALTPPGEASPATPAPSAAKLLAGAPASQIASSAAPTASSRPSRPALNPPVQNRNRPAPRYLSPIPAGSLPSPVVGSSPTAFPAPVETAPLEIQSSAVSFPPPYLSALPPEAPSPLVASEPSPPPPLPKAQEKKPYIQISIKEAPPPRRSESPFQPEPAPRTSPPGSQPAAVKRDLRAEAEAHEARAMRLSAQGDYRAAIQAYQQALETAPDSPRAGQIQHDIGLCYQKLKQHRQALASLKKAEQKLAQQAAQGGADRLTQRALQSTREAIKASEAYLQEGTEGS